MNRKLATYNQYTVTHSVILCFLLMWQMANCWAEEVVASDSKGSVAPHPSVAKQLPVPDSAQYRALHEKIAYGKASLAEIRMALTESNPLALVNVMQALYAMKWHRGVLHLLDGLWTGDKERYPELAWPEIESAPTRIALASTINRVRIMNTKPQLDYIRQYVDSDDRLIAAQVAVALGFNGDAKDLDTLKNYSAGDNAYIAQSAITGLGLFGSEQAQNVLIDLLQRYKDSNRGNLIKEVLKRGYDWPPAPMMNPLPADQVSAK